MKLTFPLITTQRLQRVELLLHFAYLHVGVVNQHMVHYSVLLSRDTLGIRPLEHIH